MSNSPYGPRDVRRVSFKRLPKAIRDAGISMIERKLETGTVTDPLSVRRQPNQQWFVRNGQIAGGFGSCLDLRRDRDGARADHPRHLYRNSKPALEHFERSDCRHRRQMPQRDGKRCVKSHALILSTCQDAPSQKWTAQFSRAAGSYSYTYFHFPRARGPLLSAETLPPSALHSEFSVCPGRSTAMLRFCAARGPAAISRNVASPYTAIR